MLSIVVVSAGPHWERLTAPAIKGLEQYATGDYELIVVDNGGSNQGHINLPVMVPYGEAINRGAYVAKGDRLLLLNNDIIVTGDYMATLSDAGLEGPTIRRIHTDVDYVEGWAISIKHSLWDLLGGFDINLKNSWEDVDLSWRARLLGYPPQLIRNFPISHIYNGTRQYHEGSNQWDWVNEAYFARKKERYADR